jgi:hypothetical protein
MMAFIDEMACLVDFSSYASRTPGALEICGVLGCTGKIGIVMIIRQIPEILVDRP